MIDAKFVWEKLRLINRLPGAHALWRTVTGWQYRDGRITTLRNGPGAGLRWRHYAAYQTWMAMGLYEPHVAAYISATLKPGHVFYDVGANAGYFTLIAARRVGSKGEVVAFDPLPLNVRTITEQIALNGLQQVCRVENVAIAGKVGDMSLVIPERHSTANAHLAAMAPHVADEGQRITVQATTLDDYVARHNPPSVVKIDIEGAEVAALEGARRLLGSVNAPLLMVSTHSHDLAQRARSILADYHYRFETMSGFDQMIIAQPPKWAYGERPDLK